MGLDYVEYPVLPVVRAHIIVNSIVTCLAVVIVGLRVIARFQSGAGLWWDDFLVLFALPQGIGMLTIQILWAPMGVGIDMAESFPFTNLLHILKMLVSYELIYSTAISTVKLSVLMFYTRVFVNRGLRLATTLALTFVVLWSVGNILQVFLICRPFARAYDPRIEGVCGSQVASFIAIGAFNIITDILILSLPLPTVWSLKMSTRAKLGLTGIFLIGLVVSFVAIIRIVTLTQLDLNNLTGTMIWPDFWSTLEPNLAIICVSLPMLSTMISWCTQKRGASKLEPLSEDTDDTRFDKRNKSRCVAQDEEDHILEDIYAPNTKVYHRSTVAVVGDTRPGWSRDDSSEAALAPEPNDTCHGPGGIKVHTKWTVSRQSPQPHP